nr:hypothetical protein [uncultured Campylobacter sp.]
MNDKNFDMSSIDDIVINSGNVDKNANLKKGLTVAAGVVVLFLIILIIMKVINKDDIDTTGGLTMPSEAELAKAEQKQEAPIQRPEIKPEPAASEPKPIEVRSEPKTEPFGEPTRVEIKTQEPPKTETQVAINTQPAEQKVEIKRPEVKDEPKKSEIKVESKKIEPKEEPKKVEKSDVKKVEAKEEPKKEPIKTEVRKIEKSKQEEQKSAKAETTKTESKKETAKSEPAKPENKEASAKAGVAAKSTTTSIANGSYVQVFASNAYDPNGADTKKITKKGYNPIALQTHVGSKSMVKILVGPFEGEALQKALSDMRSINSGAYIYRVK